LANLKLLRQFLDNDLSYNKENHLPPRAPQSSFGNRRKHSQQSILNISDVKAG